MLTIQMVHEAQARIRNHLKPTDLKKSKAGAWLKLETTQPAGSFKVRPAFNSILSHLEEARSKGVLTSSSGNFAQAVAFACKELGVSSQIVMMSSTSPLKIERTRTLGAEVVICEPTFKDRWDTTHRLQRETGRVFVHPYDTLETIAGDGTLALELLEQLPWDFDIYVPASGGGLLSGIAFTLKTLRPGCRVIGVQPANNGSLKASWDAGKPTEVPPFKTIADALVAVRPGDRTFELIRKHVDEIILVTEDQMLSAMRELNALEGIKAEPGGCASYAAFKAINPQADRDMVCVLSGGNVLHSLFD